MKRVLVTGGCGFIGANLVPELIKKGYEVRILDNLSRGRREYVHENVDFIEGDIRDPATVSQALANVDTVFHLAAYGSVVESIIDPGINFEINAGGTLTLLTCAVKADVERFVFASTGGAVIGDANPPVNETSLPRPISPYGAGKLACEGYMNAFAGSYGLDTRILRFANVYGPFSGHKKGAVTMFINNIMDGNPICIHGDGSASRDFLHVTDLCRGILTMAEMDLPSASLLHLASGCETTISELAHLIMKAGKKPDHELIFNKARPGEVTRNFATFDRAFELLKFSPKIDLEEGLTDTWNWFKKNH